MKFHAPLDYGEQRVGKSWRRLTNLYEREVHTYLPLISYAPNLPPVPPVTALLKDIQTEDLPPVPPVKRVGDCSHRGYRG
jgi:hypothetical protein